LEELRAEMAQAVAAERVDPTSAESIRVGLRTSAERARTLRDEHTRPGLRSIEGGAQR
jgi:hypothetical protein